MNHPLIIPAIDIKNGKSVRLTQGDYSKEIIYSDDPVKIAKQWDISGIKFIHIVDLDGARDGTPVNLHIIANIAKSVNAKIQVGGGIRTEKHAETILSSGASRIILGTSICENPQLAQNFVKAFGQDKIIAGIDAKNGIPSTRGWTSPTSYTTEELIANFADSGITRIIYTDIATDGTLSGPNIIAVHSLCDKFSQINFISSGGISSLDDIKKLFATCPPNLEGVIIGKALYEKKFSLPEATKILS